MRRITRLLLLGAAAAAWAGLAAPAHAQVTGLFNTGVDDTGTPLGDAVDDPHYAIISDPDPDPTMGLPDFTVPADGFPIPPWVGNTPKSRWIGPNTDNDANAPPGEYVYRTTFNVAGPVPQTLEIRGLWAVDNAGTDIRVNGAGTNSFAPGFSSLTPFTINASSLTTGANTLEFVVTNAEGLPGNPTGLHVTNMRAVDTSVPLSPITTLFNTGVGDDGVVLADNDIDPHYSAVAVPAPFDQPETPPGNKTGASGFTGPGVVATSAGGFPIPPWVGDNATSAWVTPAADTVGPGGNYAWRTTFDLAGFDPKTADILGQWSSDNGGVDILVNGKSTGQTNPGQFTGFSSFVIPNDLLTGGVNTIDFIVNNGANEANETGPTGVRVEFLTREASMAAFLVADFNRDGRVDVADLGILATNYNQSPRDFAQGDANGDGIVNVADLGILATHYGQPRPAGQSFDQAAASFGNLPAVPEPASLGLLALGALGLVARRRR